MGSLEAYKDLANAIVEQAVLDYKYWSDVAKDKLNPEADTADIHIGEIERFFRSDWFNTLNFTKYTGKELIKILRRACAA